VRRLDEAATPPAVTRGIRPRESDIGDLHALYDVRDSIILHTHRRYTGRPVLVVKRGLRRVLEPLLQQLSVLLSANARVSTALARAVEQQHQWVEEIEADVNELRLPPARPGGALLPDEDYDQLLETVAPGATGEALLQRAIDYLAPMAPVLHAGCGGGRFLALLAHAGIEGSGVDARSEAVRACQERGLAATRGEPLQYLAGLPDASIGSVYAGGLAERLQPDQLLDLVAQAARTLQPGGRIAVTCANPLSPAGAALAEADLYRVHHYRPDVLAWLLQRAGFDGVELQYGDGGAGAAPLYLAVGRLPEPA
jgi:SAM-dependent methyltransferase